MHLFEPITIRNLRLRNRVVMPPMTTRFADPQGRVTDATVSYYVARARGGAGMITVEMSSVDPAGKHRERELGLADDRFIPGLRRLTDAIHTEGAATCIQIAHAGCRTSPRVTGLEAVAPSPTANPVHERVTELVRARALSREEIHALVARFGEAAARAREAGFDAVDIHASHGYLLFQFLSPLDNRRTDEYGGSLENRARFPLEVVRACRQRTPGLPLIFRITADEYAPGGFTREEALQVCCWAVEAGADALHVSAGSYRSIPSAHVMTPPMAFPDGCFVHLSRAVKAQVSVPVITVGRIHDPDLAERVISEGSADLVAIGRGLIADPEWPRKACQGRGAEIRPCLSCNSCVDGMRDGSHLRCLANPDVGADETATPAQAPSRRFVLVVGGGPAGMEAARRAALRGHRVELWEMRDRLGGSLSTAARAPLFQNVLARPEVIGQLVSYLARELDRLGVKVRLGQKATAEAVAREHPEVVILATGASYSLPFNLVAPVLLGSGLLRSGPGIRVARSRSLHQAVISRWRRPVDGGLREALEGQGVEVHTLGDALTPGRTMEALQQAAAVAARL